MLVYFQTFQKVSFWTSELSPIDSKLIDIKYDLSTKDLKSYIKYSNSQPKSDIVPIKYSKLEKPQKSVTFLLPMEEKISESNNEMEIELLDNVNPNSLVVKNVEKVNVITDQFSNNVTFNESIQMNIDDNKKKKNENDFGFQANEYRTINLPSNVFKKPYNSVKDGILKLNTNSRSLESVQTNITKKVFLNLNC